MSTTDLILICIGLMVAGRHVSDWRRTRRRRGAPPAARYTSLESAVDGMTQVADGMHEDIEALRRELRAAVHLPPETQVPRVMHDLRTTRLIAWVSILFNILLLVVWAVRSWPN